MVESGYNPIGFGIVLVLLVHHVAGHILFFLRRHLAPIKHLQPGLLGVASVSATLYAISKCIYEIFEHTLSLSSSNFVIHSFMILCIDAYTMQVVTMYIAYNRARNICESFEKNNNADSVDHDEELNKSLKWIKILNVLIRRETSLIFFVSRLVILWGFQYSVLLKYPALATTPFWYANDFPGFRQQTSVGVGMLLFSTLLLTFMSLKLRIVEDSLGIKKMLGMIGKGALTGSIINFLIGQSFKSRQIFDAPALFYICIVQYVVTLSTLMPLRRSYSLLSGVVPEDVHTDTSLLERFLLTPHGFQTFRRHLVSEYCVENLLFWKSVVEYRRMFHHGDASEEDISDCAKQIFSRFLKNGAALEVNLPHSLLVHHRNNVLLREGDLLSMRVHVSEDYFDSAAREILNLLRTSSLPRFQTLHRDVWDAFLTEVKETQILTSLC